MNLHRILQISKCLPPDSLHDMLFARKLSAIPTEKVIVSGYPCVLENSAGKPVVDYRIYGNTVQDGTPMPDNPVEIQSVGDLVTEGEYAGKYKIPVVASTENNVPKTTNIYLDEPLRKIGDYADVIDFERGGVERKIKKIVFDGSEKWSASTRFIGSLYVYTDEYGIKNFSTFFCSHVVDSGSAQYSKNHGKIDNNSLSIWIMESTNISAWKAYLKAEYDKGTPVTVWIIRENSTAESLTLPEIPTFDGTTVITTDTEIQPSNMEITYKARK